MIRIIIDIEDHGDKLATKGKGAGSGNDCVLRV